VDRCRGRAGARELPAHGGRRRPVVSRAPPEARLRRPRLHILRAPSLGPDRGAARTRARSVDQRAARHVRGEAMNTPAPPPTNATPVLMVVGTASSVGKS